MSFDLVSIGTLVLRISFGALLITHGYPKLTSGYKGTVDWLRSLKIPAILGPLIGVLELVGGAFLIVGLLARIVPALYVIMFLGIYAKRKILGKPKLSDYEKDLMYLFASLSLVLLGGGVFSLDSLIGL